VYIESIARERLSKTTKHVSIENRGALRLNLAVKLNITDVL
jgi:hypothetical protein